MAISTGTRGSLVNIEFMQGNDLNSNERNNTGLTMIRIEYSLAQWVGNFNNNKFTNEMINGMCMAMLCPCPLLLYQCLCLVIAWILCSVF